MSDRSWNFFFLSKKMRTLKLTERWQMMIDQSAQYILFNKVPIILIIPFLLHAHIKRRSYFLANLVIFRYTLLFIQFVVSENKTK